MTNPSDAPPLFDNQSAPFSYETTPGSGKEIQWEIVARTPGIMPAHIMAGRLQAEGIPARAWQEAAGQAYGLTVGLLGTGYVSVPEEFVDRAVEILEEAESADLEDNFLDDTEFFAEDNL